MGNITAPCNSKLETDFSVENEEVAPSEEKDIPATRGLGGKVHALICGIDYSCDRMSWAGPPPAGHGPLDTHWAFNFMTQLCQASRCATINQLWNQQCTKENIKASIRGVANVCEEGDTMIFYYTGHGDRLPSGDSDEKMDECLCTVDANGNTDDPTMQYRQQVWLRDDDFAETFTDAVAGRGVKVLVLVDACHSATICDFSTNPRWEESGIEAISITGCQDKQTSAGTGKGGLFTRSLTMALAQMTAAAQQTGRPARFSVANVYNATVQQYWVNKMAGHTQNIAMHGCGIRPQTFLWPLTPVGQYISPATTYARTRDLPIFEGDEAHVKQAGGASRDIKIVDFGPPPLREVGSGA